MKPGRHEGRAFPFLPDLDGHQLTGEGAVQFVEEEYAEELRTIDVPVLIFNGKADVANQKIAGLLKEIPTASFAACERDHGSTPYEPTFHQA